MILIITNKDDEHADALCAELDVRRLRFLRFNTEDYPSKLSLSVGLETSRHSINLSDANKSYDLSEADTVVYRRPVPPAKAENISEEDHAFVCKESDEFLGALWRLLSDKRWINPLAANKTASYKPFNLREAAHHGFLIPETIMSNDPDEIIKFAEACHGDIIYKPLTFFQREGASGWPQAIYTNKLTLELLNRSREELAAAPGIYQKYVPKAIELRITVIGDEVFACSIDSQRSTSGKVDWRRYDFTENLYSEYNLPSALEEMVRSYVRRLGLRFGCLDMILTPDDRYIFLEINPNGQWLWINSVTKLPLMEAYVNLLRSPVPV